MKYTFNLIVMTPPLSSYFKLAPFIETCIMQRSGLSFTKPFLASILILKIYPSTYVHLTIPLQSKDRLFSYYISFEINSTICLLFQYWKLIFKLISSPNVDVESVSDLAWRILILILNRILIQIWILIRTLSIF